MEYLSKAELLSNAPLILAGPMLRRTEPTAVTVWLALKRPCQVTLSVLATANNGAHLKTVVMQGRRCSVALGAHLHVVAVTATPTVTEGLSSDRIYAYDLTFTSIEASDEEPVTLSAALCKPTNATAPAASRASTSPTQSISYFAHHKPTFVLPASRPTDLKIAHGSCRKPHGNGYDALSVLDCLVELKAHQPCDRPQQLFLTGDQIYGDDVADPMLWLATSLGDALLGWAEKLPVKVPANRATDKLDGDWRYPKQLPAGNRADFAMAQAGITAGIEHQEEKTTSHLFAFGEYCAAYLLAYSPACWPEQLPEGKAATTGRKNIRRWNKDKRNMEQFVYSLWKVRRLLANIATYTIFDDHDVSDDWNLNQQWCLRVFGSDLGQRMVRNALHTYALFQAWGNTPGQFVNNQPGAVLLAATAQKARAALSGFDAESQPLEKIATIMPDGFASTASAPDVAAEKAATARDQIAQCLGMPATDPYTRLPRFDEDGDMWTMPAPPQALRWYYTVSSACHEVIVLDTRTQRGYPKNQAPIAPPMLMTHRAFAPQLVASLATAPPSDNYLTFVVAPTNVFGMRVLDWIQQWHLNRRRVFTADVGDSWNLNAPALATLLSTLCYYRQQIVVLSGDIHYSSTIRLEFQDLQADQHATLTQLTSSALKNEELLTQLLHTRLKDWLLPERPRRWKGWRSPPNMVEVAKQQDLILPTDTDPANTPPQWQCQLQWLKRQPCQAVDIGDALFTLIPPNQRRQKFSLARLFDWLKFWKIRWFQSGTEVVGRNNIALVEVDVPRNKVQDAEAAAALSVVQSHYWFSAWQPVQVVRSRFE